MYITEAHDMQVYKHTVTTYSSSVIISQFIYASSCLFQFNILKLIYSSNQIDSLDNKFKLKTNLICILTNI